MSVDTFLWFPSNHKRSRVFEAAGGEPEDSPDEGAGSMAITLVNPAGLPEIDIPSSAPRAIPAG